MRQKHTSSVSNQAMSHRSITVNSVTKKCDLNIWAINFHTLLKQNFPATITFPIE
jgi:hypothetical protein